MKNSVTFTPVLNTYILKTGDFKDKQEIKIRITKNRKSSYESTGIFINSSDWNQSGFINGNEILNNRIKEIIELLEKNHGQQKIEKVFATKIDGVKDTEFFKWCYAFIKRYYTNPDTRINKEKSLNKFRDFIGKEIYFNTITKKMVLDFKEHLRQKGNIDNTINNNLRSIRSVWNLAASEDEQAFEIIKDPWRGIKTPKKKPINRTSLTEDEIRFFLESDKISSEEKPNNNNFNKSQLDNFELIGRQNDARNFFIFSFNNFGMRASDILTLRFSQIKNGRLFYSMRKSRKDFSIILQPECIDIINYYYTNFDKDKIKKRKKTDYIFPFLDVNKKYTEEELRKSIRANIAIINKNLKKIALKVGINKNLSSHVSRHSFASLTMRRTKGDRFAVMQTMGHSSSATTDDYIEGFSVDENDKISELVYNV